MIRILTWNCCRGKAEVKLPHLRDFNADVMVVQECARPASPQKETQVWYGDSLHQGLLVSVNNGLRLGRANRKDIPAKLFLPTRITGSTSFNLLAIWAKPAEHSPRYASTVLQGLGAYRNFIKSAPTVVLGDFNTASFAGTRGRDWHREIVNLLRDEFGLVSAYHEYHGIDHGYETHNTYFDRTKKLKPYHIDYCFIPKAWLPRLKAVRVGNYEEWGKVSDHTPVVVELD